MRTLFSKAVQTAIITGSKRMVEKILDHCQKQKMSVQVTEIEIKYLILSRNYETMIVLMKNNVGYVKTMKTEEEKDGAFDPENGRNIRQVFKIPSCVASGTISTDENGNIDLMEMKLAPSCFIEAFLQVNSDDQR